MAQTMYTRVNAPELGKGGVEGGAVRPNPTR